MANFIGSPVTSRLYVQLPSASTISVPPRRLLAPRSVAEPSLTLYVIASVGSGSKIISEPVAAMASSLSATLTLFPMIEIAPAEIVLRAAESVVELNCVAMYVSPVAVAAAASDNVL